MTLSEELRGASAPLQQMEEPMHYTIKMVRKGDGLVRDSTTGYFPDAETALADGSQYLIDLFPWDDDELDADGKPKDWDFEVVPNPEAAAEEDELIDRWPE